MWLFQRIESIGKGEIMNNRTFKIPKIERYTLPENYPTETAMKSWGHNECSYHPEIWEMEYCSHRLLGRMTDEQLLARYHGIVRNMPSYTAPERDVVPDLAPKKWSTRNVSFSGLFKSMDKEKRHGKTETTHA
ncbi:hypothetical protein GCM10011332_18590 [Terasakiella brassicae]|uniref:Uncharacterized protein n=1 Tax=Terasakiella brassicae TaxID=1634917 RepID=A0A917FCG2_9PROT|nr:hypothetical protein GCM10011332_18590 [Terasakiella brassicae]